jgi:hydroxymethylbilane synthase
MRVRLISRASALAVLQTTLVERALRARWPDVDVVRLTRSSAGDRDRQLDIQSAAEKGVFTSDLSQALVDGEADAVVHSWKDLPIVSHPGTRVVATLERADPRDVLLVRRAVVSSAPTSLTVLSSSPRRAWQVGRSASHLLPWPATEVHTAPVRGNVPTRLTKLTRGEGDALLVAKAALDRLLSPDAPDDARDNVRRALDRCRWMVLPLREHPTAPAQGALAIEIVADRPDLVEYFAAINHEPTWRAVEEERRILTSFGGGCHEAVGATVLDRDYGRVTSVSAALGTTETTWSLKSVDNPPPQTTEDRIWPQRHERGEVRRRPLRVSEPPDDSGFWVSRAEALPADWPVTPDRLVWTAGLRTWERLALRGVWVNGSAEGLGDGEGPDVDRLAGRTVSWRRLTHADSGDPSALATYTAEPVFPADLGTRSHFFWMSASAFGRAIAAHPAIRSGWHASGPGRSARVIRDTLGPDAHFSVWLDYDQWHQHVTS